MIVGPKLLLADDSVTIQRVIELTFADEDIDVQVVGDGVQAIEQIRANAPDIVLADTSMPEKDGYDVAAFVKNDPALARIPVVLLTGAFEPLDAARAETVGSDGVLVKPFEPQQVIGKVRELLASAAGAAAEPPAPEAVAASAPAPSSADLASQAAGPASPPPVVETPMAPVTPPPSQSLSSAPSKQRVDDGELADYFDQLDEAFASTEGPSGTGPVPADAPTRTPAPAYEFAPGPPLDDTGRQPEVAPSVASPADLDRLDLEALVEDAAKADALPSAPLADAPAPKPAPPPTLPAVAPVSPPTVASEPAPLSEASSPVPETALPESAGGSPIGGVASAAVSVSPVPGPARAAAPPQYAAGSVLAQAFATFLAVEQGATPPRLAPAGAEAAYTPLPEAMVDDVVQRVVARMTDSIVRDTTAEIVSEVAERLVRDEIDRIKTDAK